MTRIIADVSLCLDSLCLDSLYLDSLCLDGFLTTGLPGAVTAARERAEAASSDGGQDLRRLAVIR